MVESCRRPPRILIADDSVLLLDAYARYLEFEGMEIVQAIDGQEAIDMAFSAAPDVIVLDVSMPRMDGLTACRRLKSDPRTRQIPVILVTATPGLDAVAQELECEAYLVKPCDLEELVASIRKVCGRVSV